MAKLYLLDIENRKGFKTLDDNTIDKSLFPTIDKRTDGSLIISVLPSSPDKVLQWIYAKDNYNNIVDYRQFQKHNSTDSNNKNNGVSKTNNNEKHKLEITTKSIPQHVIKKGNDALVIEPSVTHITPYAIYSGEEVYKGKTVENLTVEEQDFKHVFEWAKKQLASCDDANDGTNGMASISGYSNHNANTMMDVDS